MQHAAPPSSAGSLDETYAQRLQCRRQWRGFLTALGQEFSSALPAQDLALLMARVGERFAAAHPLAPSQTVGALQEAMNGVWDALDWGQVEIASISGGMDIQHRFSPLSAAFGTSGTEWTAGFLQGVYQQWFDAAGAGGLKVQVSAAPDGLGSARLRLGSA